MIICPDYKEFVVLLNRHKVKFLIIGAHALGFHGIPRFTKDCDFWIGPSSKNILNFLSALKDFFGTDFGLSKKDFTQRAVFQFGVAPVRIDVLLSISGVRFKTAWRNRVCSGYGREPAAYLSLSDLIKAKRAAGRKQDLLDVAKLLLLKERLWKK